MSNFLEVRPVGAELFHADGRDEGNSHKNVSSCPKLYHEVAVSPSTVKTVTKAARSIESARSTESLKNI